MRHFCTLFDRNYLDRGLSLHRSLERHAGDFKLHILCLDGATREALDAFQLPRTELIDLERLEAWDKELATARRNRGLVEFYFTCKPFLLSYVLAREPSATRVEYLDSDVFFFASPSVVEASYAESPVALSPHRFDAANAWRRRYGEFNAGWVSVSASSEGRRFIEWWRQRCIESCALVPGREIFGDQKYLDRVPASFPAAVQVSAPGVNAAPWNIGGARVERLDDGVRIAGEPLVFFHFHGMRRMVFNLHESGLDDYGVPLKGAIREAIYRPYASELALSRRRLAALPTEIRGKVAGPKAGRPARHEVVRFVKAVLRQTVVAPA